MARKKNNRVSLEENKRTFRRNQAMIARAERDNEELEKIITEQEDFEIVGIIRKHKIGLDDLAQVVQGIRPSGESLLSEEKLKPVSAEEIAALSAPKRPKENKQRTAQEPVQKNEQEDTEHETE